MQLKLKHVPLLAPSTHKENINIFVCLCRNSRYTWPFIAHTTHTTHTPAHTHHALMHTANNCLHTLLFAIKNDAHVNMLWIVYDEWPFYVFVIGIQIRSKARRQTFDVYNGLYGANVLWAGNPFFLFTNGLCWQMQDASLSSIFYVDHCDTRSTVVVHCSVPRSQGPFIWIRTSKCVCVWNTPPLSVGDERRFVQEFPIFAQRSRSIYFLSCYFRMKTETVS